MDHPPLKPCPFCGSSNVVMHNTEARNQAWAWVECRNCFCSGPDTDRPNETLEEAARVWNTRV